jgi:hypothetical protein
MRPPAITRSCPARRGGRRFNKGLDDHATDLVGHARLIGRHSGIAAATTGSGERRAGVQSVAGPAEGFLSAPSRVIPRPCPAQIKPPVLSWDFNHDGSIDLEGYGLAA